MQLFSLPTHEDDRIVPDRRNAGQELIADAVDRHRQCRCEAPYWQPPAKTAVVDVPTYSADF